MIASRTATLRRALGLLSIRLVLQQIALALFVLGLFTLWLRIPDSRVSYIICTVLLGLLILAVAGVGESWLLVRLTAQPATRSGLLRGALILLGTFVIAFIWSALFAHIETWDQLLAGYLNSQATHSTRNALSDAHILKWLEWLWLLLRSLGYGILAAVGFAFITSAKPTTAIKFILRSGTFWIVFLLALLFVPSWMYAITQWTPGHGLRIELFSLIARLCLVVLLAGIVVSFILATLAASARESETL